MQKIVLVVAVLTVLVSYGSGANAASNTWNGGTGNWEDALDWSLGVLPGGADDALVDGGNPTNSTVNLNSTKFVNQLLVTSGDRVVINPGALLQTNGGITNDGLIELFSSTLKLNSNQTIQGSGQITLSDSSSNQITSTFDVITLAAGQTISGAGQLGANTITNFNNNGLVRQEGINALRIDTSGAFNNNTQVDAVGAGGVILEQGTFNGGAINVLAGSALKVKTGVFVNNSVINTAAGTFVDIQNAQTSSASTSFTNITLNGELRLDDGEGASFDGMVNNHGQITLGSTGNQTDLRIGTDPFFFNGPGEVILGDNANNRIISTSDQVTNSAGHMIRGAGQIGANTITNFTNNGDIVQEGVNQLVLDVSNSFTNNGILKATGGGGIRLNAGQYNLNNIDIETGSALEIVTSANVNASTFNMAGGTFVDINSSAAAAPSLLITDSTLNGVMKLDDGEGVTLRGMMTNNGVIELNSSGNQTDLRIGTDPFTFTGTGEIQMGDDANNRIISSADQITNDVDHTIRGAGQLGVNTITNFTNEGAVIQEGSNQLVLDVSNTFTNNGTLKATGSGGIRLNAGQYSLNDIDIESGSALEVMNSANINSSTLNMAVGTFVDINNSAGAAASLVITDSTLNGVMKLDDGEGVTLNGLIVNNGVIELNSTGSLTDLRIGTDPFSFTGTGEVKMSDNANNRIISSADQITNDVNHTIRGAGQLGVNTITNFTNNGTVIQEGSNQLVIDISNTFTNNGTLKATGSGGIKLNAGQYSLNNIDVEAGSALEVMNSANVNNSTFNMAAGTFVDINNSAGAAASLVITDSTLNGVMKLDDGEGVTLNGMVVNNGVIELNSTGNLTDLRIGTDPFTFTGTGEVLMSDNANNRIISSADQVINEVDHTIRGAGQLGANSITNFNNKGAVVQEGNNQLVLDVSNTFTNNGTLKATGPGGIKINAGQYYLNDIDIEAGSALEIVNSANVYNSTFNMAAGTFVDINNAAGAAASLVITDSTLNGELRLDNGEGVTLNDAIENNGKIALNSTGTATDIRIGTDPFSFNGNGELVMSDNSQNRILSSADKVTNGANHTIRGAGQIGANSITQFTNAGAIIQEGTASLTIDTSAGFTNTGHLQASGSGGIVFDALDVTSSGSVKVDSGSSITLPADLNQTGGSVQVEGIITVQEMHLMNSALWGGGVVEGDVFAQGSTVVGLHNSLDTLDIVGDYLQGAGSTFAVDIFGGGGAGIGHDFLDISGIGTLMGDTIDVLLDFGFASGLAVGDKFDIMSAMSLTGGFASVIDNLADFELIHYIDNDRLWVEVAVNNINTTNVPAPAGLWLFMAGLLALGGGRLRGSRV